MRTTNSPLYVSDLDGTLLHNDTSLSQYSRDTLNAPLKEQATGIIDTNEEDGVTRYISTRWYGTLK